MSLPIYIPFHFPSLSDPSHNPLNDTPAPTPASYSPPYPQPTSESSPHPTHSSPCPTPPYPAPVSHLTSCSMPDDTSVAFPGTATGNISLSRCRRLCSRRRIYARCALPPSRISGPRNRRGNRRWRARCKLRRRRCCPSRRGRGGVVARRRL